MSAVSAAVEQPPRAVTAPSNTSRAQSWQRPHPVETPVSSCSRSKLRVPDWTAVRMSRSDTRWQSEGH